MNKKYVNIFMVAIMLFSSFNPCFLNVEAKGNASDQPEVCNGPSEMMSKYFDFQREIRNLLLGSEINEKRFNISTGKGWLFTKGSLELPSALDFLATNILGNLESNVSTAGTSIVLLMLASASVFQSNTEGLAILFKDRPIVREYKTMLDIETDLFDIAFFTSKKVNLTLRLQGDELYDKINEVIKKYQGLGLLAEVKNSKGEINVLTKTESMAEIINEFILMNTAMKHFILFWGDPGDRALKNYKGCFGKLSNGNCENPVLKFDSKAIDTLKEDYANLGTFSACNLQFSSFKKSISKSIKNNQSSVKSSFKNVKDAMNRLKGVLVGEYSDENGNSKSRDDRCDMSEYEMAQLRSYWGQDWTCGNGVDASFQISKARQFKNNKNIQNKQKEKHRNLAKRAAAIHLPEVDSELYEKLRGENVGVNRLRLAPSTVEKNKIWQETYGSGLLSNTFNPEFLFSFAGDLVVNYEQIMREYDQFQGNASSSDISYELINIRGLIDQVEVVVTSGNVLKTELEEIAKNQCNS